MQFSKLKIHEKKEIINGLIFDGLTYYIFQLISTTDCRQTAPLVSN